MLPMLLALDTLLSTVTWRERFVATCFDKDDPHKSWVELWAEDRLTGLRWQVVSNFCTKATKLSNILFCWTELALCMFKFKDSFLIFLMLLCIGYLIRVTITMYDTFVVTEVLPLEEPLRAAWNTKNFVKRSSATTDGEGKKSQPFLVEASSKVTISHLNELMRSDYRWACIAFIAHLTRDAEMVGSWAESCPCEEHQIHTLAVYGSKVPRRKRKHVAKDASAANCCFRCCRAPELAAGVALRMQSSRLNADRSSFAQYIAKAPEATRSELQGAYTKGCGRLWGHLEGTRLSSFLFSDSLSMSFEYWSESCCVGTLPRTAQHQAGLLAPVAMATVYPGMVRICLSF